MVAEALLDLGDAVRGDATEQDVLAGVTRIWVTVPSPASSRSTVRRSHAVAIGDLAGRDGQADDAVARAVVLVGGPRGQLAGVAERLAEPASTSAAEPVDAPLVDEVLEAGPLAVLAVAEVALHGDDRLGDVDDPSGGTHPSGDASRGYVSSGRAWLMPEPAADEDVVAGDLAGQPSLSVGTRPMSLASTSTQLSPGQATAILNLRGR